MQNYFFGSWINLVLPINLDNGYGLRMAFNPEDDFIVENEMVTCANIF